MSPILFYTPGSCAFGSMIALEWLEQPYKLCRVEKEVRSGPVYAKVNPFGLVPVLRHGDTTLTESFAILHHLGARDEHHRLVPKQDTAHFDRVNEILSYLTTSFHPGFGMIFHTERFADATEVQDIVKAKAIAALPARFSALERFLGDQDCFVGHHATIVDAYFYGVVRAGDAFLDVGAYKSLTKLRKRLAKDEGVIFAQAVEDQTALPKSKAYNGTVELSAII